MAGTVRTDPLFLGLTRPPMLFGVSYSFAVINMLFCLIAYLLTNQLKYFFAAVPIHMFGYYLCTKEPLFIELFKVRAEKCSRSRNRFFHGANSYDMY
ncbi:Type IV secretion system protein VirB3 [Candidatus Cyrtobacter comes]|uniref:Type IV secretion system protein VirB3 n=1 Tax=Candidatus Cyrtobacter comes TaxID=675776 RepID=A0ABU5L881_9RICK|nr:VirB3 family type IV secretion system protein [Candidatus Cyrtobacter comes]MDZ5762039.1 Type IV secretion system protein VirB3 [Candidatus Cyrtobacter comes]